MITAVGLCSKIRAGATLIQSSSFDPRIHSFLIVNRRDILLPSKYLGIESPRIRTVWGDGSGTVHVPAGLGIGMWGFGVGLVRLFGFGAEPEVGEVGGDPHLADLNVEAPQLSEY